MYAVYSSREHKYVSVRNYGEFSCPEHPNYTFFAHRTRDNNGYSVSEITSGGVVSNGVTAEDAICNARSRLHGVDSAHLRETIDAFIKLHRTEIAIHEAERSTSMKKKKLAPPVEEQDLEEQHSVHCCADCAKVLSEERNEYQNIDGEEICERCSENYEECNECGILTHTDDTTVVFNSRNHEVCVCSNCRDDHYQVCHDCGNYYHENHIASRYRGRMICDDCNNNYCMCERCEDIYREGDMRGDVCCNCYEEDREYPNVRECHDNPKLVFQPSRKNGQRYFGFELEVDGMDDDEKMELSDLLAEYQDEKFFMKEDSSLEGGFEIVSMPCSYDYLMNTFPFEEILKKCVHYHAKSHNSSNCGLHIHVSRDSFRNLDLAQLKLLYLFERFWNELFTFSRRRGLNTYCKKNWFEAKGGKLMEKSKQAQQDRYYAVNFSPYKTIEIRLWRGTLKLTTIKACLQMTALLSSIADNDSIMQLQKMTWEDIIKRIKVERYKELYAYLTKTTIEPDEEGEK